MAAVVLVLMLTLATGTAVWLLLRRRERARLRRWLAELDDPNRTAAFDGTRRAIGWQALNDAGRKYL